MIGIAWVLEEGNSGRLKKLVQRTEKIAEHYDSDPWPCDRVAAVAGHAVEALGFGTLAMLRPYLTY